MAFEGGARQGLGAGLEGSSDAAEQLALRWEANDLRRVRADLRRIDCELRRCQSDTSNKRDRRHSSGRVILPRADASESIESSVSWRNDRRRVEALYNLKTNSASLSSFSAPFPIPSVRQACTHEKRSDR